MLNQKEQEKILRDIRTRITEEIHPMLKPHSSHDTHFILNSLQSHFIFYNLQSSQLLNIAKNMFYAEVSEFKIIFNQGDNAHCFFIIEKGSVEVVVNQKVKKQIKSPQGFGQLALLYNTNRTSTVRTKQQCSFWVIDRKGFKEAVQQIVVQQFQKNRRYLQALNFYNHLTTQNKDQIAASLVILKYYKGQNIIQEGDPGSAFFIVKQGTAIAYYQDKVVKKLHKGDSFGQQSLYYNTVRKMTIQADSQVVCLVLGRQTLVKIFGQQYHSIMFRNTLKSALQRNNILGKLTPQQIDKVVIAMKLNIYKGNDIVFKRGLPGSHRLIVLIQGNLKKVRSGLHVCGTGEVFGWQYMSQQQQKEIDDDILMQNDGITAQISDTGFIQAIGGSLFQVLSSNNKMYDKIYKQDMLRFDIKPNLQQLVLIQKLQITPSSSSFILLNQNTYFHLKQFHKKYHIDARSTKQLCKSKKIRQSISFPFISYFVQGWIDKYDVYFLSQWVHGQELFQVIRRIGLLSTNDAQFYVASMILICEYLFHRNIIHRDLKPENFIVDQRGYLKLTSFSSSTFSSNRQGTIIGTPHYMAPQVVMGRQYGFHIDLWAVGIMLFQFLCGYVPFGQQSQNPYQIYESIVKGELNYPKYMKDSRAKKILEILLSQNPEHRNLGSFHLLKKNQWFNQVDWVRLYYQQALLKRKFKTPQLPKIHKIQKTHEMVISEYFQRQQQSREKKQKQFIDIDWKDF